MNVDKNILKIFNENHADIFGKVKYEIFITPLCGDYSLLNYLYPMIERIIRDILDIECNSTIENENINTFKTLNGIIENNRELFLSLFNEKVNNENSNEILAYLENAFKVDGPRNVIMHYSHQVIEKEDVIKAQYIFWKLIKFYVERYCIEITEH